MTQLIFRALHGGPPEAPLSLVSALHLAGQPGQRVLYAASDHEGLLSAWALVPGSGAVALGQMASASAPQVARVAGLASVDLDGVPYLLPATPHDGWLALHPLDAGGSFAEPMRVQAQGMPEARFSAIEAVEVDGRALVIAARVGAPGIDAYRLLADGSLIHRQHFADREDNFLADVGAFATGSQGDRSFLFAASTTDAGVTAFQIRPTGDILELGSVGPADGLWISQATALEFVEVKGAGYLVVAAAGSGSLSTLRVNNFGEMILRDHVIDTQLTRFGGVSALTHVAMDERVMVIAAGNDGGITLFDMASDGNLFLRSVHMSGGPASLLRITALAAEVVEGEIQLFVSTSTQPGVAQFTIDPGPLGAHIVGNNAGNELRGGPGNDLIEGRGGADVLIGGPGDDRLIDGPGPDIMVGGPGADIFTLIPDNHMDRILDFEPGIDRIDFSKYPGLYSMAQLGFSQHDFGVLIDAMGDRVLVRGYARSHILIEDFTEDSFIF
ncbi:MAG: hypothetical protein JJU40_14990 [Rhodobacteraceae bacterium]|nr:hypothetical protein [Paracoccaceae bacterium]